jgi:hypothetical protein
MPPGDVTELSYAAELYQHNAIRVTPDRQSGLENDVWARLAGGAHLRILVAIRVLGSECHKFIWSEEDDHSLRGGNSGVHHLADVRACFPGGDQGLLPLDGHQPDGAQECEDGPARGTVSAVHHKYPAFPLGWRARSARWLISPPGGRA